MLSLSLASRSRVFVAREPVDFRKAHDGLCAIVRDGLAADPFAGNLFSFRSARRWGDDAARCRAPLCQRARDSARVRV